MQWEYFTAFCYHEKNCKLCKKQSHWALNIFDDKHHWIQDGLNTLGAQGWELVAVQQTYEASGYSHHPPHYYIFKRPVTG